MAGVSRKSEVRASTVARPNDRLVSISVSSASRDDGPQSPQSGQRHRHRGGCGLPLSGHLQITNCLVGGLTTVFTTVFVEPGAFWPCPTPGVFDYLYPCGRIATPDRQAFRGVLFTTVFGRNNKHTAAAAPARRARLHPGAARCFCARKNASDRAKERKNERTKERKNEQSGNQRTDAR